MAGLAAGGLEHPFRHDPNLAQIGGQQGEDTIGLTDTDVAKDYGVGAIDSWGVHLSSLHTLLIA